MFRLIRREDGAIVWDVDTGREVHTLRGHSDAGGTRRIGGEYIRKCLRILQLPEMAGQPDDMNISGFRFHGLKGNPKRWSVRVSGNYRITFGWSGKDALDIDFEDYH